MIYHEYQKLLAELLSEDEELLAAVELERQHQLEVLATTQSFSCANYHVELRQIRELHKPSASSAAIK